VLAVRLLARTVARTATIARLTVARWAFARTTQCQWAPPAVLGEVVTRRRGACAVGTRLQVMPRTQGVHPLRRFASVRAWMLLARVARHPPTATTTTSAPPRPAPLANAFLARLPPEAHAQAVCAMGRPPPKSASLALTRPAPPPQIRAVLLQSRSAIRAVRRLATSV
jgi:hypothetical protein